MTAAHVPIRHIDGVEIPTKGTWAAVSASSIVGSAGLSGRRAFPVVAGWFDVAEDPAASSLRIDLDDSTLFATTKRISTVEGRTEWLLEGFAARADRHDPLTLSLQYHGVFRRGVDVWAWLSGTGTIRPPADPVGVRRPRAGGDRLAVELLFIPPGPASVPRVAPLERTTTVTSRVMQIPSIGSQPIVFALR